ncbi:hypothetical protein BDV37DRAFT_237595 [Aspergillus pseudonomiae]|uniref:Uncharacterized protein n=1 Tax=Aspergillus pseudonomiae TaxID=1506151 RepID=A0A5N7DR58_9EURO|nr:uncharacterized protein BDV37DRAFT_237595 [Aspergillus pseudonomiae]KAE8408940.1 hypothetical protein BDV37DRAFT_237595 [Aspergillus pseudonomiae]
MRQRKNPIYYLIYVFNSYPITWNIAFVVDYYSLHGHPASHPPTSHVKVSCNTSHK